MPPLEPFVAYKILLKSFGPQGWWPVTKKGIGYKGLGYREDSLRPKYHPGKRIGLTEKQAFEIAVGAILTQNTTWKNVEKAIVGLNKRNLIDPKKILTARDAQLIALIRSSGYFNQKAKKLRIFSQWLLGRGNGFSALKGISTEVLRRELLGIWGIGPETTDSILLYALGKPVFVIDAYTRRMGERLGWPLTKDYEGIQRFFESSLPKSVYLYQEFHALIVRLAKENCAKNNPQCIRCPLAHSCAWGQK